MCIRDRYTTRSGGAAQNLPKFKAVHPDVEICFTGDNVFSDISNASATTFKEWIGRTPVMWWNYSVNDAEDSVFFTNPINFDYSQDPNPTNIAVSYTHLWHVILDLVQLNLVITGYKFLKFHLMKQLII